MPRAVVELLLEWCADLFGVTARPRNVQLFLVCLLLSGVALCALARFGVGGLLLPVLPLFFMGDAAMQVIGARGAAWRAACLRLDDPRQLPHALDEVRSASGPTALALRLLGLALNDARRGRCFAASETLPRIDRALLRADEERLLDAVRALISLGLGDTRKAAQQAATALPTGSEELDASLGRTMIAESWHQPDRLRAIRIEWKRAGVGADQSTTLARLHRLARLRIDERLLDEVSADEARVLSDEARAVGDEDLAADLDSRARGNAYR